MGPRHNEGDDNQTSANVRLTLVRQRSSVSVAEKHVSKRVISMRVDLTKQLETVFKCRFSAHQMVIFFSLGVVG